MSTHVEPSGELSGQIIGAAIEVHRVLGPGLLESAYQTCLAEEFLHVGIPFEREVPLPITYRGKVLDCGYRMDFVVGGLIVVELKAIKAWEPIHEAQLLTHMRLATHPLGLLINFNVPMLRNGIIRRVLSDSSSSAFSASLR
ncbi:MAG: GxxExxY protein [Phycisphaerales bacterium]